MRANTMVWVGIRHVGDSTWEVKPELVSAVDASKKIGRFIASTSMAQRFDFCLARTEAEVVDRLTGKGKSDQKEASFQIEDDFWDSMETELMQGDD